MTEDGTFFPLVQVQGISWHLEGAGMSCFCGLCCLVPTIPPTLTPSPPCLPLHPESVPALCSGPPSPKTRDPRSLIGPRKVGLYWVRSIRIFSKKKVEVKFLISNLESYRNVKWMQLCSHCSAVILEIKVLYSWYYSRQPSPFHAKTEGS